MKNRRHAKILELIAEHSIETQEDLAAELKQAGYEVTQATVSRDIKELGLIKTLAGDGGYKYASAALKTDKKEHLHKLFAGTMLSIQAANNIIVIKTMQGSANTVAVVVDGLENKDILGCVAGDDTILVVVSSNEAVPEIMRLLNSLIQ